MAPPGADDSLMDAGMESLGAIGFRENLSSKLQGIRLPSTLIFGHSTARAIYME